MLLFIVVGCVRTIHVKETYPTYTHAYAHVHTYTHTTTVIVIVCVISSFFLTILRSILLLLRSTKIWEFYFDEGSGDTERHWYQKINRRGEELFHTTMRMMMNTPNQDWTRYFGTCACCARLSEHRWCVSRMVVHSTIGIIDSLSSNFQQHDANNPVEEEEEWK